MTITMRTTKVVYLPDGTQTQFSVPFPVFDEGDVECLQVDGLTETLLTAFTVFDDHVTFSTPPTAGKPLVVRRRTARVQESDYPVAGRFPADVVERDFDRLTAMVQELDEQIDRAVLAPSDGSIDPGAMFGVLTAVVDDAQGYANAAAASAGAAAGSADNAGAEAAQASADAAQAANHAADAKYWAQRAEGVSNNGPASPDLIGGVKPGAALSVQSDGTLDLNAGPGLTIDPTANSVGVDASAIASGTLSIDHGGTGASTPAGALESLGLTAWQADMEGSNSQRLRNAVLSGRTKDGYPAYLVGHEFLDMQHENGVYNTKRGTVSASTEYSTAYTATKPLRNQVVYQSEGWLTAKTVPSGWWQYDFADGAHVLSGMFLCPRDNQPTFYPKTWALQGWNTAIGMWENIYAEAEDRQLRGASNNLMQYGRMYWFADNIKAYDRIRLNITANWGGTYLSLGVIRFYEAVLPGMHKYDVALYASEAQPFAATIACGLSPVSNRTVDKAVWLTTPVVFDGTMLTELTRNYMYLVPATAEGSLPANLDCTKAVPLPGQAAYLYTDTRKLHYGTVHDISAECLGLLQSRYTVAGAAKAESNMGSMDYPVNNANVQISLTEQPRGAISSYYFPGSPSGWISPGASLLTTFPAKNAHPYSNEMTVEVDFKWTGPADTTADGNYCIFDNGEYTNRGWRLVYRNRRKCLTLHLGTSKTNAPVYHVPFNANDDNWHTVSVSMHNECVYIHVDGVCLGAYNNVPIGNPNYRYWMLGRIIASNDWPWYGYLNNFRLTLGTALYKAADYTVTPTFYKTYIPHKTLWYDAAAGVVKEWQADTRTWLDTPMLPIGHVDTDRREHLLTDQPLGTYLNNHTKYVDPAGYLTDSSHNTNRTPASLFNFGDSGVNAYVSGNDATVAHYAQWRLDKPMTFDRMQLLGPSAGFSWTSYPCKFSLSGSVDGATWTTLIDRTAFVDDGGFLSDSEFTVPNVYDAVSYKTFTYDNPTAYQYYRLDFPAKADVTWYKDYGYTCTRAILSMRGSKPQVLSVSSYCIGSVFSIGPIFAAVNNEIEIPLPFANVAFDAGGFVDEENDYQVKRRFIGQSSNYYSEGNVWCGETIYQTPESVIIQTANSFLSIDTARHNTTSISNTSINANIYIVAKKRY